MSAKHMSIEHSSIDHMSVETNSANLSPVSFSLPDRPHYPRSFDKRDAQVLSWKTIMLSVLTYREARVAWIPRASGCEASTNNSLTS